MNDPLHRLDRLARLARREAPPRVEVRAAVLRQLAEPAGLATQPLAWVAAASCAAAVAVCGLAYATASAMLDPVSALVRATPVILP